ncbi:MAG: hypothetical protein R2912_03475 [Eubacteriales bacterium]
MEEAKTACAFYRQPTYLLLDECHRLEQDTERSALPEVRVKAASSALSARPRRTR